MQKGAALFPSLAALGVIATEANGDAIRLESAFLNNLKTALASLDPAGTRQGSIPSSEAIRRASEPSQSDLIEYTKQKWESMLIPLLSIAFPGRFDKARKQSAVSTKKMMATLTAAGLAEFVNLFTLTLTQKTGFLSLPTREQ